MERGIVTSLNGIEEEREGRRWAQKWNQTFNEFALTRLKPQGVTCHRTIRVIKIHASFSIFHLIFLSLSSFFSFRFISDSGLPIILSKVSFDASNEIRKIEYKTFQMSPVRSHKERFQ